MLDSLQIDPDPLYNRRMHQTKVQPSKADISKNIEKNRLIGKLQTAIANYAKNFDQTTMFDTFYAEVQR